MPFTQESLAAVLARKFDDAAEAAGTTGGELQRAMEEAWTSCVRASEAPDLIIVNGPFMLAYRRAMRPARRQIGGSSIRAIKRRAVRRPW